jgi:Zn-dependent protease with chaperone function
MVSPSPKPLGNLKLHPFTHLGLLLCTIGMSDRFFTLLPLAPLPALFLQTLTLLLGFGLYWGIVQNRQTIQKISGSLNLRLLEIGTIVLWGICCWNLGQGGLWVLARLGLIIPPFSTPVVWGILGCWGLSFLVFPWIIDRLLQWQWQLQPLQISALETVSPEASKLLRSFFTASRRLPLPPLGIVPSPVPLCFSYGFSYGGVHRSYRVVISQGVLDRLGAEEIAGLFALELGYLQERSSWVLPWLVFWAQVPYVLYWFLGTWGDRLIESFQTHKQSTPKQTLPYQVRYWSAQILAYLLGVAASDCYGLFKVLRFLLLPLARQRCYYGDRLAAALTGNPNAYSRALLSFAHLQATDVETRGFTHPWLEGLELLLPLGYTAALTLHQAQQHLPLEQALSWDSQSPYRHWLTLNCAHPPIGDRLYQLQHYAQRWNLTPELCLPEATHTLTLLPAVPNLKTRWSVDQGRAVWNLVCQSLPYTGVLLGLGLGLSFWFLSALANLWGFRSLAWGLGDLDLLKSCIPLGIALGILLRHNLFFPNLPRRLDRGDTALYQTLHQPNCLPLQAKPIQETGTLLGRSGLKNWLGQDLWLQSPQGLVRLHYSGVLGVMTALWPLSDRPAVWVGRSITVSGWLRRGSTLWLDLVSLASPTGFRIRSFHGVALLVLAGGLLGWSSLLLLRA